MKTQETNELYYELLEKFADEVIVHNVNVFQHKQKVFKKLLDQYTKTLLKSSSKKESLK